MTVISASCLRTSAVNEGLGLVGGCIVHGGAGSKSSKEERRTAG